MTMQPTAHGHNGQLTVIINKAKKIVLQFNLPQGQLEVELSTQDARGIAESLVEACKVVRQGQGNYDKGLG